MKINRYSENDSYSYCLGMSLTVEALKNRYEDVTEVLLSSKANRNSQLDYLLELCRMHNVKVIEDDHMIEKLSLKENCYCIGIFKKFYSKLNDSSHIVLYGFSNYGDLGTILRSSVSFDFKNIVLINSDIDYFNPACVRASMGSIFHTNIVRYKNIKDYLKDYPNQNLIPFTANGKTELKSAVFNKPYSIIISENYNDLDDMFKQSYYLSHNDLQEISLSIRSSIILSEAFYRSANDKNI